MLTEKQIQSLKQELIMQKEQLENQLGNDNNYDTGTMKESVGELSSYDNHPADSGTELFERGKGIALNEHHVGELKKTNKALNAIDEGTYGKCAVCNNEISIERLKAIPNTLYCLDHTPEQLLSEDRPIEEDVLEDTHNSQFQRLQNEEMADNEDSFADVAQYGTSEGPQDLRGDHESYDNLYKDSSSGQGFTEDYESYTATNIKGKNRQVINNREKEDYEDMLDREKMQSKIGDVPYHNRDGYIEDKTKKETD
ncbi:TraR/DksA C4-type zinc finger protein [Mesobacillus harenae]|uniref:TraR/DksA C4-type zinc finger protein n=1 Tax=Mesobacillus harenae TaxID=2213203 RepID=UPI00157FD5D8|nr:TraR/DksA C4-type zinc finger protein [Mesobacillus harenae]